MKRGEGMFEKGVKSNFGTFGPDFVILNILLMRN